MECAVLDLCVVYRCDPAQRGGLCVSSPLDCQVRISSDAEIRGKYVEVAGASVMCVRDVSFMAWSECTLLLVGDGATHIVSRGSGL
jgi:hypothetical protein